MKILPNVGSDYKIAFDLKIYKYDFFTSAWFNILTFTVDNPSSKKYGDRVLQVMINKDKQLYICSLVSGNPNYCRTAFGYTY